MCVFTCTLKNVSSFQTALAAQYTLYTDIMRFSRDMFKQLKVVTDSPFWYVSKSRMLQKTIVVSFASAKAIA